jgi:cytochrome P450
MDSPSDGRVKSYTDLKDKDPYPQYAALREAGTDVYWDEGMNAWMVLGYRDCALVQRDEMVFEHPYLDLPGAVEIQGGERNVLLLRGEEHKPVHRFLLQFFSVARVEDYRTQFIGPLVDRLLARFASDGQGELSVLFAEKLPAYVICALLGVPMDDEELLERCRLWNDDIMRWSETFGEDPAILSRSLESSHHLNDVLLPIIRERRDAPGDDFISALWREGPSLLDGWNEGDVLAQARVLLFAGSETTAHLIRNGIYFLATHPQLQMDVRDSDDAALHFVEELLRYYGVIHFRIRSAGHDTELGGATIHAGERVHPVLSAANRDSRQFADPDEFHMDRSNAKSNLAFGHGKRKCVGANLARGEAAEALRRLLARMPNLRLDPASPAPTMHGHMPRSYVPLFCQWGEGE